MIRKPDVFFSEYGERHGIGYPLQFLLVTVAVSIVPLLGVAVVLNSTSPLSAVFAAAFVVGIGFGLWVGIVLEGLLAHAIASLFGASGATQTLEAYAFPSLVRYGLWWFPIVNIVLGCYGLYLQIKGLSAFHDISMGNAAIAAVVAMVLVFGVLALVMPLVAAVLAAFVLDMGAQT
ncbi:hypothetical protein D8Y22_03905 [Salinadaptatus halalkaliphilus]|uniref:Yip1 domain-containing protein n=2 Tax=Salinadaptatus halalkaliphilus TaxID=2419781 RepID=A0A4S3TTW6_9EURY|nr:hypothetical protein D8Y22_03905 [Salinadaptatus halalkaliphilus]